MSSVAELVENMKTKFSGKPIIVFWVQINKKFQCKIVNIFLPIFFSICFGCSKEPSH